MTAEPQEQENEIVKIQGVYMKIDVDVSGAPDIDLPDVKTPTKLRPLVVAVTVHPSGDTSTDLIGRRVKKDGSLYSDLSTHYIGYGNDRPECEIEAERVALKFWTECTQGVI